MRRLLKGIIDAAKPAARDFILWDGEIRGFGVRIRPTGRKVFIYVYRANGGGRGAEKRKMTIGTFGSITLEQARAEAQKLAGQVASGRCPATERDTRRVENNASSSVAELVTLYLADRRAKRRASTVDEYERALTRDALPKLGRTRVKNVTRAEIAALHRSMADRPYMANRVLAMLHSVFEFAERNGLRADHSNPCTKIDKYPEEARERFLSEAEFAALGAALLRAEQSGLPTPPKLRRKLKRPDTIKHRPKSADQKAPANPFAVAAIRFLMLSGWREREALTLKWEYLDEQRGMAFLPTTKTGRSARALGTAVWDLLESLPRLKDCPYVFPGSKPGQPMKDIAWVWECIRYAAGLETLRLHDLRHSHASVAAGDIGLPLLTIGALLGHNDSATTGRYAHLADNPAKRGADAVAARVKTLLTPKAAPAEADAVVLPFARPA